MPRPLVYSNGSLFVGVDGQGRIRDLYHPHVGLYNHLSGNAIRMGVWVDDRFSWIDEEGWTRSQSYADVALIGRSTYRNELFRLEIALEEWVDPEALRFERSIEVRNHAAEEREVRVFFTHDLHLAETDIGDTALYDPFRKGIIHYKGHHAFLFQAGSGEEGLYDYACGTKGFGGLEGTWRDAEDGRLSMNPIAQGSVDSTMSIRTFVPGGGAARVHYRITASTSLDALPSEPFEPDAKPDRRRAEDRLALRSLDGRLDGLPDLVAEVARRSLLIVEAMCDHSGAILAATDSDIMATARAHYGYTWPRDAAHVVAVLDRIGRHEPGRRYFEFCKPLISETRPFLMQKYRPDQTLGATWHPWVVEGEVEIPFQEDETASFLDSLAGHLRATGDDALLQDLYGTMVRPMADFLNRYRDPETGLPRPSYDLWEERRGVHAYTVAAVWSGLRAAAALAERMGDGSAAGYLEAAESVRAGAIEHMRGSSGHFLRRLDVRSDGSRHPDDAPDASTLWLGLSGMIDASDPLFEIHMRGVWEALWVNTEVGGMARYRDDYYFRASREATGNPWIITTMWLAQCLVMRAETRSDLDEPLEMLLWAARHAGPTGVLPEQVHPHTGAPLSVSPLTWSHAEFLKTALDWAEKRAAVERESRKSGS
jgi:GH15 family glucan-1,4-alpha-glucosidase